MERRNHKLIDRFNCRAVSAAVVGLGILSAPIYWLNFKIDDFVSALSGLADLELYVVVILFLSGLYAVGSFLVVKRMPREETSWKLTGIIIFLAIVFRLALIAPAPAVLSNDMYRYIWDGRVQQNGINPFFDNNISRFQAFICIYRNFNC